MTAVRTVAAVLIIGTFAGSCSDLYLDRRETVALGAADAVAVNRVVETIDPWPPAAADRSYVSNGDKISSAAERYRTGKIIQPKGLGTTATWGTSGNTTSGGATDSDVGSAKSYK
jgi:hypothetical protein